MTTTLTPAQMSGIKVNPNWEELMKSALSSNRNTPKEK